MEGVLRKRLEHSVGQWLGRMVWRGVCEMDSDMIDKLETEIVTVPLFRMSFNMSSILYDILYDIIFN